MQQTKPAVINDYLFGGTAEICVYAKTFYPGTKVEHRNEGQHAGSNGIIRYGVGEIIDVDYTGENVMGMQVYVAVVKWENGHVGSYAVDVLKASLTSGQ